FSPDSRRVLAGCQDGSARLWDLATAERTVPPLAHTQSKNVRNPQFSPDGRRVLTGGDSGTAGRARVWGAATGEPVTPWMWHDAKEVGGAAFSPDGDRIVTFTRIMHSLPHPSCRYGAQVWDATTGTPVTLPVAFRTKVNHAAFSPDGRRFAVAAGNLALT